MGQITKTPTDDIIEINKPKHGKHDPPLWDFWWLSGAKWARNKHRVSNVAVVERLKEIHTLVKKGRRVTAADKLAALIKDLEP